MLVVVGVLAVALVWAAIESGRAPQPVGRGLRAPAFELPDLGGGTLSLADLRGRLVLVNFWATWCKPCEDEMPSMQRLYAELEGRDFELVAISVDTDFEAVRVFRERLGISFPILLDPDQDAARAYQTTGFPESFLVDRDGVFATQRFVGPRAWDDPAYVALVRRLLAVEGPARPGAS